MAEISRIQGPSGPPESGRPRGKKVDQDKFKEEMRRIEEVGKTDPDEAKKRKRPEEALRPEEEELIQQAGSDIAKKGEKTERTFKVPSSNELSSSGKAETSTSSINTQRSEEEPFHEESASSYQEVEESTPKKALTDEEIKKGFLQEVGARSGMEHILKSRQAEVAQGATMPAAPDIPEEEKKKAAAKGQEVTPVLAIGSSSQTEPSKVEEPTPEEKILFPEEPPPSYTHLHPDVLDIFERMIGALVFLDQSGIKETTLTISSSTENPSIFNGTQITIREYSTAPKEFNVELAGSVKAVELFQNNQQELMDAFDKMPYTFKVKNIQTSLK